MSTLDEDGVVERAVRRPRGADLSGVRRAEVLDATEQLLAVHGFDAVRLRDVAARAGVSIGLIQHYFATREELLHETIRIANERRARIWSSLADSHERGRDKLTALLAGSLDDPHRCLTWLETCAAASRHAELIAGVRRTQDAWREVVRAAVDAGVAEGDFRPALPVEDVADLLVGLMNGFMLAAATEPSDDQEAVDAATARRGALLEETADRLLRPTVSA